MKHDMRTILAMVLAVTAILGATQPRADLSIETVQDLSIENASVTVLANGDIRLRFSVANDSPETVIVTGLSSPLAQSGEIIGASHHGAAFPVTRLIIQPDAEIDFATSHIQARLTGVTEIKDALVFHVLLDDGAVIGKARVH